jgi:hypothetical protein
MCSVSIKMLLFTCFQLIEDSDAEDDLFEISQKTAALQFVLSSKSGSITWESPGGELLSTFVE